MYLASRGVGTHSRRGTETSVGVGSRPERFCTASKLCYLRPPHARHTTGVDSPQTVLLRSDCAECVLTRNLYCPQEALAIEQIKPKATARLSTFFLEEALKFVLQARPVVKCLDDVISEVRSQPSNNAVCQVVVVLILTIQHVSLDTVCSVLPVTKVRQTVEAALFSLSRYVSLSFSMLLMSAGCLPSAQLVQITSNSLR